MNDVTDTFGSSISSNKRLSRISPDCEENDDTQEKKEQNKRNSTMFELGLSSSKKNKVSENIKSSAFTSEQISNHYGDCMKLASENKITSKNAFDLHLIDYLQDYMQRLKNFQKVSSTLDAGAKIYAGRVDMVHSHTYHILNGCSSITENVSPEEFITSEEKLESDDFNAEVKSRRQKRRIDGNKNMTCNNIRRIRLTKTQIRSESDILFQGQAVKYDEGNTGELRLNNTKILDDTYKLLLDSESIVKMNNIDYNDKEISSNVFDIFEYSDLFQNLSVETSTITSEFEGFKFTGWDPNSDILNSEGAESFKNLMHKETEKMEDDLDDDNDVVMLENDCERDVIMSSKADEEDNMLTIGSSKQDGSSFFVTSVKEMVNSYMENYGEINDDILGMWAGPDHWKQKAKPLKLVHNKINRLIFTKSGKKSKEVIAMFPEWIKTRLDSNNVGRLVDIEYKNADLKTGPIGTTQLTDVCLNKNIKKEYVLPERNQFVFNSINQLMNRDISLVNKALKKHTEQMSMAGIKEGEIPYEEKMNDEKLLTVSNDIIVIDNEGNISKDINEDRDNESCFSDGDPYTGNSFRNCNFDDFGTEINEEIRATETMDITYAKIAKKINVKKLKQEMLTFLIEKIHIDDMEVIKEKVYANPCVSKDTCKLSDLIVNVDTKVSSEVSKELSVSILMTCLLHLANETGLDIASTKDFSDFIIRQGFSEYDCEQIVLYGGVDNNVNSKAQKRKSKNDSSAGCSKTIRRSFFADSDDDSS